MADVERCRARRRYRECIASYNLSISRVLPRRRKSKYETVVCTYATHSSLRLFPLFLIRAHSIVSRLFSISLFLLKLLFERRLGESICRIDRYDNKDNFNTRQREPGKSLFYLELTDFSLSFSFFLDVTFNERNMNKFVIVTLHCRSNIDRREGYQSFSWYFKISVALIINNRGDGYFIF